ncbi:MAG: GNAT family N-acetyltransferase [Terracidiphilus sp.]
MLLRPAKTQDAMDVARVHVRSWQAAYRGLLPAEYLDALKPEDRAALYTFESTDMAKPFTIVAEDDGFITGFATTAPARDADFEGWGELYALYVDPDFWGRGFGAELMKAARARLVEVGFQQAVLWMMKGIDSAFCCTLNFAKTQNTRAISQPVGAFSISFLTVAKKHFQQWS